MSAILQVQPDTQHNLTTTFPLVSVVLTAYNYADLLAGAIDSALAQDYPHLEILILDDASTDTTPEVAEHYVADPRVHSIRHEHNLGSNANVNYGIQHSRGEYIMVLSADNRMAPGLISTLYRSALLHPDIDLHYGRNLTQNALDGSIRAWDHVPVAYQGGRNEFAGLLSAGCYICTEATLVKRDIYERYGPVPDCCVSSDLDLLIRWAAAGLTFAHVPEAQFLTIAHPGQASAPGRYVATGKVAFDYLHLLQKYAIAEHAAKLRGYEQRLIRTLKTLEATVRHEGYHDAGRLASEVRAMTLWLEEMQQNNRSQPLESGMSLLVLDGGDPTKIDCTLTSLLAQEYSEWEALILDRSGYILSDGFRAAAKGRIKIIQLPNFCIDTVALNIGLQLVSYGSVTFAQAGTCFSADEVSQLMEKLNLRAAPFVLRTPIDATGQESVAPNYPLHGITVQREALDHCGSFDERLTLYYAWEFVTRIQKLKY